MTDDDIGAILGGLDRPLAPPPEVAERMWARAAAALRDPATGPAQPPAPSPDLDPVDLVSERAPARLRLRSPRSRLLVAAAVVAALGLIAGLLAALEGDGERVTAAGSGAPFRARVRTTQATPTWPVTPQPTPAPSASAPALEGEQIVSHGGDGHWRVDWVKGPAGVGGPGSFQLWDRDRILTYKADTNTYSLEDPDEEVTNTAAVAYVDLDEAAEDCDRVERSESGGVVAGRSTRLLRCVREATATQPATTEETWVDAITGLLLRKETKFAGELAARSEVVEVDYSPEFDSDTFSLRPPDGAREDDREHEGSALGSVLVPGREAPGWEAPQLGGGQISTAGLRGRPAAFLLWSSWCEPCVGDTLVAFDRARSTWADRISLVSVAVNDREADAAAKVGELGLTLPVALDPKGDLVTKRWDLRGVPAYVFLDGSGIVAGVRLSPLTADELGMALGNLSVGQPVGVAPEPPPPPPCEQPVTVEAGPGAPGVSGRIYFGVLYAPGAYGSCPVPAGPYVIAPDGSRLRRMSDEDSFRGVAVSVAGELVREVSATGPERRDPDESQELWLVRTSLQPRTKLVERGSDPVWSHDGQRVAFVRKNAAGAVTELAIVDRDGAGERTIAVAPALQNVRSRVAWEFGDRALLVGFDSGDGGEAAIVRYSLEGQKPRSWIKQATTPAVSRHDGMAAFVQLDEGSPDHRRIGLARADGSGRRFLTPPRSATVPAFYELDFSPDGAWLVASGSPEADDPYPRRRIYLIEVATGTISELATLGTGPSW